MELVGLLVEVVLFVFIAARMAQFWSVVAALPRWHAEHMAALHKMTALLSASTAMAKEARAEKDAEEDLDEVLEKRLKSKQRIN